MQLSQISITTSDLEILSNFYKSVFGMFEVGGWDKPEEGMRAVKLQNSSVLLEITEVKNLIDSKTSFDFRNKGLNMFGFEVEDIHLVIEEAIRNGGKLVGEIREGKTVRFIAFITDPDGNGIELIVPKTSKGCKIDFKVEDYDRAQLWSSGNITSDLNFLDGLIKQGRSDCVDRTEFVKAVKKAGDICGCPVPHKVIIRLGEINAFRYLYNLSIDFNYIKNILKENSVGYLSEWGREEKVMDDEPWGEDASNVPEEVRAKGTTGNFHEFSVTKMLWLNKEESNFKYRIDQERIQKLVIESKSVIDLQVNIVSEIAKKRIENGQDIGEVIELILNGIAHAGILRQLNCYGKSRKALDELNKKIGHEPWFSLLQERAEEILMTPIAEFS